MNEFSGAKIETVTTKSLMSMGRWKGVGDYETLLLKNLFESRIKKFLKIAIFYLELGFIIEIALFGLTTVSVVAFLSYLWTKKATFFYFELPHFE